MVERRMWWKITGYEFVDYGSSKAPEYPLGYFYGTRAQAEVAGRGMPGYDSWGGLRVDPLCLEDVNRELSHARSVFNESQEKVQELQEIRDTLVKEMGL